MKIYRVQNTKGQGCYRNDSSEIANYFRAKHFDDPKRPTPQEDNIPSGYYELMGCLFGFKSIAQLHNWFTIKDLIYLSKNGFKVVQVEGYIYAESKYQVVFAYDKPNKEDIADYI